MLRQEAGRIEDPMLMLALFYCIWINTVQRENTISSIKLRDVQKKLGLMGDYFRHQKIVEDNINFDSIHRTLVLQHAYLTNGSSDFVTRLGPATMSAINRIKEHFDRNPVAGYKYECAEIKQYVRHMQVRALTEMQHRHRMLEKITMYLQVVSLRLISNLTCSHLTDTNSYTILCNKRSPERLNETPRP